MTVVFLCSLQEVISISQIRVRTILIFKLTSHPGQLSLAIPPWVGAMSTSESFE